MADAAPVGGTPRPSIPPLPPLRGRRPAPRMPEPAFPESWGEGPTGKVPGERLCRLQRRGIIQLSFRPWRWRCARGFPGLGKFSRILRKPVPGTVIQSILGQKYSSSGFRVPINRSFQRTENSPCRNLWRLRLHSQAARNFRGNVPKQIVLGLFCLRVIQRAWRCDDVGSLCPGWNLVKSAEITCPVRNHDPVAEAAARFRRAEPTGQ